MSASAQRRRGGKRGELVCRSRHGRKARGSEEVMSQKRRSERWDGGEERRAGTLATVAAARSRWQSWPPRMVTLCNTGQTQADHTYSIQYTIFIGPFLYLFIFCSLSPDT